MKNSITIGSGLLLAVLLSLPVLAHADAEASGFQEARMEGQLWATYALNEHLNPFDLSVEVDNDTAILTGTVKQDVSKALAEQIALSVDGIESVDNRITVDEAVADASGEEMSASRSFGDRVSDATTTAAVKSKLLWNRETSGLAIEVETENGVVELSGEAEAEANKELAERLAANTRGVERVINNIEIERR